MRARILASLLGLLLCCGAVAAAARVEGEISAATVALEGAGLLEGQLLALYRLPASNDEPAPIQPHIAFRLTADQARVETYESDPSLVLPGTTWYSPVPPGYQPHEETYSDVDAGSAEARSGYRFVVVSSGDGAHVRVASGCGTAQSPSHQEFEAPWRVAPPSRPVRIDISSSTHWQECGTAAVTVTGDFTLVLWEIDTVVRSPEGNVDLPSGNSRSDAAPQPAADAANPYISQRRQQYLYVEGGTLDFALDASPHELYVAQAHLDAEGSLRFRDSRGALGTPIGTQDVSGTDLQLRGQLGIDLAGRFASPLTARITGNVASAEADGQALALASTAAEPVGMAWPWALGAVGVVAAGGAALLGPRAVRAVRARPSLQFADPDDALEVSEASRLRQRSEALYETLRFEEALVLARQAVAMDQGDVECHYQLAQVLAALGRHDEAGVHRLRVESILARTGRDVELRAMNAYQAAEPAGRAGKEDVAREWLQRALELDPRLIGMAGHNPHLQSVLEDATMPFWLRR